MSFYWRKQDTPGRLKRIAVMRQQLDYLEKCLREREIPMAEAAMLAKNAVELSQELAGELGGHKQRLKAYREKGREAT